MRRREGDSAEVGTGGLGKRYDVSAYAACGWATVSLLDDDTTIIVVAGAT